MSEVKRIGLIGARGYTGRELIELVARHPHLELAFASSRELDATPISDLVPEYEGGLDFEAIGPDDVARRHVDVIVLGMPNGKAEPYVQAIDRDAPDVRLVDLSADYRFREGWTYGLPERDRTDLADARRIANPGCYATAAQLALLPIAAHLTGPATVFGISGYSGAGTTPSRKNDPDALRENVMPYALVGHNHQPEMSSGIGRPVHFMPCVAEFFRGLVVTCHAPIDERTSEAQLIDLMQARYADEPMVRMLETPAEPQAVAGTYRCDIGPVQVSPTGDYAVVTAALDNLLKGAASQAIQNINLSFDWDELAGLAAE